MSKENLKINRMTEYSKRALEQQLLLRQSEVALSLRAIGDAAGRESDWHDNAAFDYANEQHRLHASELRSLQEKLKDVEIITPQSEIESVSVGNTVVVQFEGEEENEMFTILGPDDSDKQPGWISYMTPLGSNLLGKKIGDQVSFRVGADTLPQKVLLLRILPGDF